MSPWLAWIGETVASTLPFAAAARISHGTDHAIRTALLACRLAGWARRHGVVEAWTPTQLALLLLAALLHDAGRASDHGPDGSSAHSVSIAAAAVPAPLPASAACDVEAWLAQKADWPNTRIGVEAAILQAADSIELVRSYEGIIDLRRTALSRLAPTDTARQDLDILARSHLDAMWGLKAWGLPSGAVVGATGATLRASCGAHFDPMAILRRNLSTRPTAEVLAAMGGLLVLERALRDAS